MVEHVAIAIAHGGYIEPETVDCFIRLFDVSGKNAVKYKVSYQFRGGCFLAWSRSTLVLEALKNGADAVLMIDSDQTFPPHALDRLVSHDLPYVGCTYPKRDVEKGYPLMRPVLSGDVSEIAIKSLVKMHYLPGGFQYVRKEVYEAVGYPFYRAEFGLHGDPEEFIGDDVYLGSLARNAGFDVWCDLDLTSEIGHLLKHKFQRNGHALGGYSK